MKKRKGYEARGKGKYTKYKAKKKCMVRDRYMKISVKQIMKACGEREEHT